jgi:hypothetical protein
LDSSLLFAFANVVDCSGSAGGQGESTVFLVGRGSVVRGMGTPALVDDSPETSPDQRSSWQVVVSMVSDAFHHDLNVQRRCC